MYTPGRAVPGGDLAEMPAEQINRVMAINYMGTVNVTKAVLPGMLARDAGQIAIIGSMAGSVFMLVAILYCYLKAGLW